MGIKTAVFINPFLMSVWKKLWSYSKNGDYLKPLNEDDIFEIHDRSAIGHEYLRKLLISDTRVKYAKSKTLDQLCLALLSVYPTFYKSWHSFSFSLQKSKAFRDCETLTNRREGSKIDPALSREIAKQSRHRVEQILDGNGQNFNIPYLEDPFDEKTIPKPALREDIEKIYKFALYRYGDCALNGPEIKTPWWEQNKHIFYVIHDNSGEVVANINLLPLRPDVYLKISLGQIQESEIKAQDLFSEREASYVKFIYVEGLNCKTVDYWKEIVTHFPTIIRKIAGDNTDIVIGAIGGTPAGENLMTKLGFDILTFANQRIDQCNFFQVPYQTILAKYRRII